ncbi:hypothetical protein SEPCBS119000_001396 [Sporothrix epigloea]|uniref:Zn(2)-C6 fungal-type domain-containing protein n=1 Tax=Sporothrix epigloea TaxID=1892477 RepID=A0ABP0DC43_9PEZI
MSTDSTQTQARPQRLLRISRACDFCHKRRIKCQDNAGDVGGRCRSCIEFQIECTYARPSRRGRGTRLPPRTAPALSAATSGASDAGGAVAAPVSAENDRYSPGLADGLSAPHPPQASYPTPPIKHQQWQTQQTQQPHQPHQPQEPQQPLPHVLPPRAPGVPTGEHFADNGYSTDDGVHIGVGNERLSSTWQAFAHTSTPIIRRLACVYHETVFPIFPFFDPVRLQRRLAQYDHASNRAFFSSVMAACALASARARDGALSSPNDRGDVGGSSSGITAGTGVLASPTSAMGGSPIDVPPEMFYAAAEEALPKDILQCRDFEYLRALALLSIASIQDAKIAVMQKYIGHYFTLLAINQWHDETKWPQGLHPIEVEERRRLYWSTYTLDVFTSIIWDGCIHWQESHAKVEYPTGICEVGNIGPLPSALTVGGSYKPELSPSTQQAVLPQPIDDPTAWMVGWNFTTNLYRILEHNLNKLRSRSSRFSPLNEKIPPTSQSVSSQDRVTELYAALPFVFKQLQPATGDPARDIFSFQAANIQATMALLEMVHLSLEVDVDVERKCSVVHNVLQTFHQVPRAYMRAISTPLIYHISGIGIILGTVIEGPLSESAYNLVRDLLLSMALLLESLEAFLHRSAGAGSRLRTLAARLDARYTAVCNQVNNVGDSGNRGTDTHAVASGQGANHGHGSGSGSTNDSYTVAATANNSSTTLPPAGQPNYLPSLSGMLLQQPPQPEGHMTEGYGQTATTFPPQLSSAAVDSKEQQQYQHQPLPHHRHYQHQQQEHHMQHPLETPITTAEAAAAAAAAASGAHPASWVTASGRPNALAHDANVQLHLPGEFLQGWTWPFAVSNNYLSF